MALGYKFRSQCSHENFKHRCRSQEIAAVPYIFPSPSLFLSGAAHLGCYETNMCECDGVPTLPSHHCHPPFRCAGLSFLFILVWIIIAKTVSAVYLLCVMSHCLYLLLFALPLLSLCLKLKATVLLGASSPVLSLWCSVLLWVQRKASWQWRSRIRLFSLFSLFSFFLFFFSFSWHFVRVLVRMKRFLGDSFPEISVLN